MFSASYKDVTEYTAGHLPSPSSSPVGLFVSSKELNCRRHIAIVHLPTRHFAAQNHLRQRGVSVTLSTMATSASCPSQAAACVLIHPSKFQSGYTLSNAVTLAELGMILIELRYLGSASGLPRLCVYQDRLYLCATGPQQRSLVLYGA